MIVVPKIERLPELGQVWGNPASLGTFKLRLEDLNPQHWQDLCRFFVQSTRDRGYIIELPEADVLEAVLQGIPQLLGLTLIYGTPEAVEVQVQNGPESYLIGGWLVHLSDTIELSMHTCELSMHT